MTKSPQSLQLPYRRDARRPVNRVRHRSGYTCGERTRPPAVIRLRVLDPGETTSNPRPLLRAGWLFPCLGTSPHQDSTQSQLAPDTCEGWIAKRTARTLTQISDHGWERRINMAFPAQPGLEDVYRHSFDNRMYLSTPNETHTHTHIFKGHSSSALSLSLPLPLYSSDCFIFVLLFHFSPGSLTFIHSSTVTFFHSSGSNHPMKLRSPNPPIQ